MGPDPRSPLLNPTIGTGEDEDCLFPLQWAIGRGESALVLLGGGGRAAVIGFPITSRAKASTPVYPLTPGSRGPTSTRRLVAHVRKDIGPFAAPDVIHEAPGLPKTRSIAEGDVGALGNTSTLADPDMVEELVRGRKSQ